MAVKVVNNYQRYFVAIALILLIPCAYRVKRKCGRGW
jgi:hypothetical protein